MRHLCFVQSRSRSLSRSLIHTVLIAFELPTPRTSLPPFTTTKEACIGTGLSGVLIVIIPVQSALTLYVPVDRVQPDSRDVPLTTVCSKKAKFPLPSKLVVPTLRNGRVTPGAGMTKPSELNPKAPMIVLSEHCRDSDVLSALN